MDEEGLRQKIKKLWEEDPFFIIGIMASEIGRCIIETKQLREYLKNHKHIMGSGEAAIIGPEKSQNPIPKSTLDHGTIVFEGLTKLVKEGEKYKREFKKKEEEKREKEKEKE